MDIDKIAKIRHAIKKHPLKTIISIVILCGFAIAGYLASGFFGELGRQRALTNSVFQKTPNIRVTYYIIEGPILLGSALRGYGFSPEDGFTLRPHWLKNQIYHDLESILSMIPAKPSATLPYDIMLAYGEDSHGKELWYDELYDYDVPGKPRSSSTTARSFYGSKVSSRGPNLTGPLDIYKLLERVRLDAYWTIDVNYVNVTEENHPIPFDAYRIFGLPNSSEVLPYLSDPISRKILARRPDLKDLVFVEVFSMHGAYYRKIWVREMKMLVLGIENTGEKPIGLSAIIQRTLPSVDALHLRSHREVEKGLATAVEQKKGLPVELLRPNEHLFIPLQLKLGFATTLRQRLNFNWEGCIEKRVLPSRWWQNISGETITLDILRSVDRKGNALSDNYKILKSVFDSKPDFEQIIEREYYIGNIIDVEKIMLRTGSGTLTPWQVRRFDPNNLVARGAFEKGSCPILFVQDGNHLRRLGPILFNAVTRSREEVDTVTLDSISDKFLIHEQELETTYIDSVNLRIFADDGTKWVFPPEFNELLSVRDGRYLKLKTGDKLELFFKIPRFLEKERKREIVFTGYYIPDTLDNNRK